MTEGGAVTKVAMRLQDDGREPDLDALRREIGIGLADCLAGRLSSRSVREIGEGVLARGAAELDRGESEDFDDVMRDLDDIIDRAERRRLIGRGWMAR